MSGTSAARVQVMVVDDHLIFAQAVRALLEEEPRIEVVGVADTGAYALELADARVPDVALVDAVMPGWDGFEVTRRLRRAHPDLRVIVVSGVGGNQIEQDAIAAGADAFLHKGNLQEEIAATILAVAAAASRAG
jgi:two-component system, NarL family, invasion response regulator UvrY